MNCILLYCRNGASIWIHGIGIISVCIINGILWIQYQSREYLSISNMFALRTVYHLLAVALHSCIWSYFALDSSCVGSITHSIVAVFFFFNSCSLNIQARPNEIIMSTDWNIYIYTWYTSLSTCGLESMTKAKVRCIKCNLLSVHRIYLYAILWSVWVWVLLDFGSNYCCSQSRLHGSLYFCTQKHRSARTHRHTYIYIYAHAYIYAQRVHQRIPKIVPPKYMCTYRVSVSV